MMLLCRRRHSSLIIAVDWNRDAKVVVAVGQLLLELRNAEVHKRDDIDHDVGDARPLVLDPGMCNVVAPRKVECKAVDGVSQVGVLLLDCVQWKVAS